MLKVEEFVQVEGAWAVAFRPDLPSRPPLRKGLELRSGMRSWTVTEVHEAPAGLVACRLEGPDRITIGLFLRPADEAMESIEFAAYMRLLIRLSRAFRHIDLPGLAGKLRAMRSATDISQQDALFLQALEQNALIGGSLVQGGATVAQLDQAAGLFDLVEEL